MSLTFCIPNTAHRWLCPCTYLPPFHLPLYSYVAPNLPVSSLPFCAIGVNTIDVCHYLFSSHIERRLN